MAQAILPQNTPLPLLRPFRTSESGEIAYSNLIAASADRRSAFAPSLAQRSRAPTLGSWLACTAVQGGMADSSVSAYEKPSSLREGRAEPPRDSSSRDVEAQAARATAAPCCPPPLDRVARCAERGDPGADASGLRSASVHCGSGAECAACAEESAEEVTLGQDWPSEMVGMQSHAASSRSAPKAVVTSLARD